MSWRNTDITFTRVEAPEEFKSPDNTLLISWLEPSDGGSPVVIISYADQKDAYWPFQTLHYIYLDRLHHFSTAWGSCSQREEMTMHYRVVDGYLAGDHEFLEDYLLERTIFLDQMGS